VATKEHKRQAKALVEELESRVHGGTPIRTTELVSARDFLLQSDFSPASDYFGRLRQIQDRLQTRTADELPVRRGKHDYGGEAAGYWMQVQSSFDHVILSLCYEGEFNWKRGRIKISHRFNQEGRIDFVEAKLLRSLDSNLDGAIRKLLMIKNFQSIRKDWLEAEAFVLEILPKELIFLYDSIFRCERTEILGWLTNIGHRQVSDLLSDLSKRPLNSAPRSKALNGGGNGNGAQKDLSALRTDETAWPILARAASLEICRRDRRFQKCHRPLPRAVAAAPYPARGTPPIPHRSIPCRCERTLGDSQMPGGTTTHPGRAYSRSSPVAWPC
jgi:hypothetical protein